MVMAVTFPPALVVLYAAIAATLGFGGYLIWRGQPLEIDEKLNFGASARGALAAPGAFRRRLPNASPHPSACCAGSAFHRIGDR